MATLYLWALIEYEKIITLLKTVIINNIIAY
jgi:hypothetical protein